MFTGDPNTKEPFNSWIERTLLKSEARSTTRSQRQRLKNELKISMGWVRNFYFLKISTVIKISTVFSLLLSVFKLNFNISECLRYQTGKTWQEIKKLHVNRIRGRVSFYFGKEIQKDVCRLVTSVGYRKNSESPWGNEPQTFGFRAPMFYHWETDSTVNEVYYEVHMTCVLHTVHTRYMTWERVSFELGKGKEKDVFRLVTSVGQSKHSESPRKLLIE